MINFTLTPLDQCERLRQTFAQCVGGKASVSGFTRECFPKEKPRDILLSVIRFPQI